MKIKANTNRIPGMGKRSSQGKSLMEMLLLLAIAYFGVSTGVDWVNERRGPQISDAQAREMAYQAVVIANTAERAGVDLIVEGDITKTVERVAQGGTAQGGSFHGQYFGMNGIDPKMQDRVREFLELKYGRLSMKPSDEFLTVE